MGAVLGYLGHALMENRNGLIVGVTTTHATGTERDAAIELLAKLPGNERITVGADKCYDTADFIENLRALQITPHIAQNNGRRRSAIDGRTTRHRGYDRVLPRDGLAIIFHVDGFGGRAAKLSKYRILAVRSGPFFNGFKLFYHQDVHMLSAPEVLRMNPSPDLVTYE